MVVDNIYIYIYRMYELKFYNSDMKNTEIETKLTDLAFTYNPILWRSIYKAKELLTEYLTSKPIVYLEYPTDLRGWPKIKEGHETAEAQYIMWQMKLIEFYNGKLPQYIVKELEKRWYVLCGKARGDDSMPTSEELKQITLVPTQIIRPANSKPIITIVQDTLLGAYLLTKLEK